MARSFNGTSSDYLQQSTPVVTADGFAVAAWVYPAVVASGTYGIWTTAKLSAGSRWQFDISSGTVRAIAVNDTGSAVGTASASGSLTANVWGHAAAVYASATDRRAYRDGGNKGTNATSVTLATPTQTGVGCLAFSGSRQFFWSGRIAEVGVWDLSAYPGATAALRADAWEAAVLPGLAAGAAPGAFPLGLLNWWPLLGRSSPEPDGRRAADLTVTGTAQAEHPRVYYPRGRRAVFVPAAGGGGGSAAGAARHHYVTQGMC